MRNAALAMLSAIALAGCGSSTATMVTDRSSTPSQSASTPTATRPSGSTPTAPSTPAAVRTGTITRAAQSVVPVACPRGGVLSKGTGFKFTAGFVVTAAHVVRACSHGRAQLQAGGETGFISQFDPTHDLALLNSQSSNVGALLPLATSLPAIGEPVTIIGYPSGQFTTRRATVTALGQTITAREAGYSETQTDAIEISGSVAPGDSGGPAINAAGAVVGVVEGYSRAGGGYLIPSSDVDVGAGVSRFGKARVWRWLWK